MKTLVTGATGFMGSHVVDALLAMGERPIHCFVRWRSHGYMPNLAHLREGEDYAIHHGDLTDPWSTRRIICEIKPDRLFHVAAHTHVPYSYGAPTATLDTNAQGTINLLEAVRTYAPECKVLVISSGEVYGHHDGVITEESALNVRSPYGLGKLAEDRAAYMYQQAYGMNILIARSFSQSGPRKYEGLVDSHWCKQVAMMEQGKKDPTLRVGLLTPVRTFCDVRDMAQAYLLFMREGQAGDLYNLCGDEVLTMQEVLDLLADLTPLEFQVREDPRLIRPTDVGALKPSSERFRARFGWHPTRPYWTSLRDLLEYWRYRVSHV